MLSRIRHHSTPRHAYHLTLSNRHLIPAISSKIPFPPHINLPALPHISRDHPVAHIPLALRSPAPSHRITKERRSDLLSVIPTRALILILFATIAFCLTHPGYKITRINDQDYIISTIITPAKAAQYVEHMTDSHITRCAIRDARLPDGTFVPIYLDLDEAQAIADSDQPFCKVKSTWRHFSHYNSTLDSSGTIVRTPVRITYQAVVDAIAESESPVTRSITSVQHVNVTNDQGIICLLKATDLVEYRQRMHVAGANSIFIPLYFQADNPIASVDLPRDPF